MRGTLPQCRLLSLVLSVLVLVGSPHAVPGGGSAGRVADAEDAHRVVAEALVASDATGACDRGRGLSIAPERPASSLRMHAVVQQAALFNPSGEDPRRRYARDGIFAPIGALETERPSRGGVRRSIGTATVVSPCYILSVHHVIHPPLPHKQVRRPLDAHHSPSARMRAREEPKWTFEYSPGRAVEVMPTLEGRYATERRTCEDWSLLRMAHCQGLETGWFELSEHLPAGVRVNLLAYYPDHGKHTLMGQQGFRVDLPQTGGAEIEHYGPTLPMASGGPLLYDNPDTGMPTIFALNKGHRGKYAGVLMTADPRYAGIAVSMKCMLSKILPYLQADIEKNGRAGNPVQKKIAAKRAKQAS